MTPKAMSEFVDNPIKFMPINFHVDMQVVSGDIACEVHEELNYVDTQLLQQSGLERNSVSKIKELWNSPELDIYIT